MSAPRLTQASDEPLRPEMAAVLRELPRLEIVTKTASAERERLIAQLRKRGLMTVKLRWEISRRGMVARDLALTDAGADALRVFNERSRTRG